NSCSSSRLAGSSSTTKIFPATAVSHSARLPNKNSIFCGNRMGTKVMRRLHRHIAIYGHSFKAKLFAPGQVSLGKGEEFRGTQDTYRGRRSPNAGVDGRSPQLSKGRGARAQ